MGVLPKLAKDTGVTMKYTTFIQELIMTFIVDLTSEYKRVYEIGSRYPDVSLTLLRSAFSHSVYENKKEVDIFDVENAILSTKLVYPDVIKKDMPTFYEKFKDVIRDEKMYQGSQANMAANLTTTNTQMSQSPSTEPTIPKQEEILDREGLIKPENKVFTGLDENIVGTTEEPKVKQEITLEDKEEDNQFDDFFE